MSTIRVSWKIFPDKKGLLSGIVLSGFGLSPVVFNLIAQGIINPNNEIPSEEDGDDKFYSQEIGDRVPNFFITLVIVFASLFFVAMILMQMDGVYKLMVK